MKKWTINRLTKWRHFFIVSFLAVVLGISQLNAEEAKTACGIYIINADGTGKVKLTSGKDWGPKWSPDGKRIAYCFSGGIYVMNIDGSEQMKLADSGSGPIWSPDSNQIVYSLIQYPNKYEIYIVDANGKNRIRLSSEGAYPTFSPDGKRIAFAGKRIGIFVVNSDGTGEAALSKDYGTAPRWSPDGKRIAYHRVFPDSPGKREIALMNADGSGKVRVAESGSFPIWLPDSKRLSFSGGSKFNVVNADGTNLVTIIKDGDYHCTDFGWSPDGKRVVYYCYKHPDMDKICVIDDDGSDEILLAEPARNPSWSPDGKRIVFAGVCK